MKKKLLSLALTTSLAISLNAQTINNSSFEDWSTQSKNLLDIVTSSACTK